MSRVLETLITKYFSGSGLQNCPIFTLFYQPPRGLGFFNPSPTLGNCVCFSACMVLYRLIYRSSAAVPMTDDSLLSLLERARKNNAQRGISGILLHGYGFFIQLLEGDAELVRDLYYNHICLDTRHNNLKVLHEGEATNRLYSDWAMAFRPFEPNRFLIQPAYIDPDQPSVYGRDLLSPLRTLEIMEALSRQMQKK